MRTLLIIILLGIYTQKIYSQNNLKIITYNIWNGYEWGKDLDRKNKLIAWVTQQNPDIVAWQELCAYTEEKLNSDAKKIGHTYSFLLKESGYSVGITSKYPIEIKEKILTGMHHGAIHCQVAGIDLFIVHLSPQSFMKRKSEATIILNRLENIISSNKKYIVLGDFNAHSPFDADLYKNNVLLNKLRKNQVSIDNTGNLNNNEIDFEVMSMFLSHPLIDLTQKCTNKISNRGSFPTRALGKVNNETFGALKKRLERVDYILASPEMSNRCITSKVYNRKSNWFLSDHYPVMALFDLQ